MVKLCLFLLILFLSSGVTLHFHSENPFSWISIITPLLVALIGAWTGAYLGNKYAGKAANKQRLLQKREKEKRKRDHALNELVLFFTFLKETIDTIRKQTKEWKQFATNVRKDTYTKSPKIYVETRQKGLVCGDMQLLYSHCRTLWKDDNVILNDIFRIVKNKTLIDECFQNLECEKQKWEDRNYEFQKDFNKTTFDLQMLLTELNLVSTTETIKKKTKKIIEETTNSKGIGLNESNIESGLLTPCVDIANDLRKIGNLEISVKLNEAIYRIQNTRNYWGGIHEGFLSAIEVSIKQLEEAIKTIEDCQLSCSKIMNAKVRIVEG